MRDLPDRFVRLDEVKRRGGGGGGGTSMIDRLIREGKFPPRYKLSPFASRWSTRKSSRGSTSRAEDFLLAFRADATGDDQHDMAA